MGKTALITGASSGIGYELSKIFAKNGYNLVLVARNALRLAAVARELENQYGIIAWVASQDLSRPLAVQNLYDDLSSGGIVVDVLVNDAGFGLNGEFADCAPDKCAELMQVNIASLTMLCRLFGADMVKRRAGGILNVASTAAFQPGPLMAMYYASKAYVLSFSEAIGNEFARYGVNVSVLCPGPTNTEFADRAGMNDTAIMNVPWAMEAADVAAIAFAGLMKKKRVIIPGFVNKLLVFGIRFGPRSVVTAITRFLNKKKN